MIFSDRSVSLAEAHVISDLVHRSFGQLAAGDFDPVGRDTFLGKSSPDSMREALRMAAYSKACFDGDRPVGFILLPRPSFLAMLFVDPALLRRGIGRRLWEGARLFVEETHPDIKTVELNSTPYAYGFYRALGFVPISAEYTLDGYRITRMACWLPARRLGAELR